MIDLIDECGEDLRALGYDVTETGKFSLRIGKLEVDTHEKSKRLGFDKGTYIIFNCPLVHELGGECFDYLTDEISKGIKKLLKKHHLTKTSRALIVGLGNPQILADSVGIKTIENIHIDPFKSQLRVFKFAPNIFSQTGINSFEVVHMLAIWQDIDVVVLIDALATDTLSRLVTSFQINDAGMTPGSAVNNLGSKLCQESLGVPCISIGVPTMLLAGKANPEWDENTILTPKDIHENISNVAKILAGAITKVI